MIKTKGLLVQISKQVEWFHADVGALNHSLQQRPEVFHSISVDLSDGVGLSVVDHFVNVEVGRTPALWILGFVRFERIAVDGRFTIHLHMLRSSCCRLWRRTFGTTCKRTWLGSSSLLWRCSNPMTATLPVTPLSRPLSTRAFRSLCM